jgi:hypothetical protein
VTYQSDHLLYSSLKPVEIACWHSHFEVLRKIADGDDDVAIILEDDIDMEWDLARRLRYVWKFLPERWDQVWIGKLHPRVLITSIYFVMIVQDIVCPTQLERQPLQVPRTYIHPKATIAHMHMLCRRRVPRVSFVTCEPLSSHIPVPSVSLAAAPKQLYVMTSDPSDHAYSHLVSKKYVKHFSLHPPPIIQTGITGSDISGMGPAGYFLMDSALERVRLWEAHKQD